MSGYRAAYIRGIDRMIGSVYMPTRDSYDWQNVRVNKFAETQTRPATVSEKYAMALFLDYAKFRKDAMASLLAMHPDAKAVYIAQRSRDIHMRQYRAYFMFSAISALIRVYGQANEGLAA